MNNVIIRCEGCGGEIELIKNKYVNILGSSICSFSNPEKKTADHVPA